MRKFNVTERFPFVPPLTPRAPEIQRCDIKMRMLLGQFKFAFNSVSENGHH